MSRVKLETIESVEKGVGEFIDETSNHEDIDDFISKNLKPMRDGKPIEDCPYCNEISELKKAISYLLDTSSNRLIEIAKLKKYIGL